MELLCQFVLNILLFNKYKLTTNENQNNTIDFSRYYLPQHTCTPLHILKCGISPTPPDETTAVRAGSLMLLARFVLQS